MKRYQKALVFGGVAVATLTPAAIVAAESWTGNGNGNGNGSGGRGNGTMVCDGTGEMYQQHHRRMGDGMGPNGNGMGDQDRIQARDGTGVYHDDDSTVRPMDGTGTQHRGGR